MPLGTDPGPRCPVPALLRGPAGAEEKEKPQSHVCSCPPLLLLCRKFPLESFLSAGQGNSVTVGKSICVGKGATGETKYSKVNMYSSATLRNICAIKSSLEMC